MLENSFRWIVAQPESRQVAWELLSYADSDNERRGVVAFRIEKRKDLGGFQDDTSEFRTQGFGPAREDLGKSGWCREDGVLHVVLSDHSGRKIRYDVCSDPFLTLELGVALQRSLAGE